MLQIHDRLGDFEILRLLGKGGMGEVYEARQFNPDRRVALKVLAPWLACDEDALERFWREARVPANLDHPGIVRIISTGKTDDGVAYYTMHLVHGVSLADMIRLSNDTPMPSVVTQATTTPFNPDSRQPASSHDVASAPAPDSPADAPPPPLYDEYLRDRFVAVARIGAQAAKALAYAHKKGFLHRDIKPSNLMVDHHDQVYLVDFGLTRALEGTSNTQPGIVPGTPWYMSPEQANGKALDERSDIYSLGVTLYELATRGLGPFSVSRQNREAVLSQVRTGQALPLRTLAAGIPPVLERIILRAMHYLPHRRHVSAEELARELDGFIKQGEPSTRSGPAGTVRRRPWRTWSAAALAIAGLVAAVFVAVNWRDLFGSSERNNKPEIGTTTPPKRTLDASQALPEILRDLGKVQGSAMPLQDVNAVPIWSERLYGTGPYRTPGTHLDVTSPPSDTSTIFALADPDWPSFEFAIEMNQMKSFVKGWNHDLGLVFGWARQPADSNDPPRFFVLQLDERPVGNDRFGRVTIGTARLVKASGDRAESTEWLTPLPGKSTIALNASEIWHTVRIRISPDKVSVVVDNRMLEFTTAELREKDPNSARNLSTSGAVGVWAKSGTGLFRRATLTMLKAN